MEDIAPHPFYRHPKPRAELARRWRTCMTDGQVRASIALSLLLLAASIGVNWYAGTYAARVASNYVEDIVLSNIPAFDVQLPFVYGAFMLVGFITALCLVNPRRAPFTLYALALFIFIRSIFISLTHLGPFPTQIPLELGAIGSKFMFGADLFFSGHTGMPFLLALIFWKDKVLRGIFLAWSVFFGTIALLGHLHYSIDVLAAFFITFSIYHLARWMFPRPYALFRSDC